MIPFNVPPCVGDELDYVKQAIDSHIICGDGAFTKQCNAWLEERFHAQKVLLTTSAVVPLVVSRTFWRGSAPPTRRCTAW